jgi:hypothetical protein
MEGMMRDAMRELFDTLLVNEPPVATSAAQVRQRGQQRLHRRRILVAAGSALAVGVTATATVAYVPGHGPLVALPATSGSRDVSAAPSEGLTPAPTDSAAPQRFEIPNCDGDATAKLLANTDGSVLPDPATAAQAVLEAAATIAPGRTFRLVTAKRVDSSEKHPGMPRLHLIFDVTDARGTGSINLEVFPQAGMTAAERATLDERAKPFGNCTPPTRTDFPDGGVGLEYVAFGTGDPRDSVQHTYYYSPDGFDINAGAFLRPWSPSLTAPPDPSAQPRVRTPMPLTSKEVLAICRIVALS